MGDSAAPQRRLYKRDGCTQNQPQHDELTTSQSAPANSQNGTTREQPIHPSVYSLLEPDIHPEPVLPSQPIYPPSPADAMEAQPTHMSPASQSSSILMLNTQGLDPSAGSSSRWKVPYIREMVLNHPDFIPFIALSETWLKPYISDAQIQLPGYHSIRSDRRSRIRGGALLYVHESLPVTKEESFDDSVCEVAMCTIDSANIILASIYRPPDATMKNFRAVTKFIQDYVEKSSSNDHELLLLGDLNFPNISWSDFQIGTTPTSGCNKSAKELLQFMSKNLLSQFVQCPTRKDNILDLALSNSTDLVDSVTSTETSLSDHNSVWIKLQHDLSASIHPPPAHFEKNSFRDLKLQKADFEVIQTHLASVDWLLLKHMCSPEEFADLFTLTVLQICSIHTPVKSTNTGALPDSKFQKNRKCLKRKKRKLTNRLRCLKERLPYSPNIPKLEDELSIIHLKIRDSIKDELISNESKAINTIKSNPRFFFSYAKRFLKKKSKIGPIADQEGVLHSDAKRMADLLQDQYSSVFSDPDNPDICRTFPNRVLEEVLENIEFSKQDLIDAIDEIDEHSSCGDHDIPAIVLKRCKDPLSTPIMMIWKESVNTGQIPQRYKEQMIVPIHKKGSKACTANYRPVSLTSHVMKIFERVVRQRIVDHLEDNNLITNSQHGFRKGRSCLSQLLIHVDDILQNLLEGNDTDAIYVDYAKAFDKVDHELLLAKVQSYGIQGKVLEWLRSFLSHRVQKVAVDGSHSYPTFVKSGVPQGTVLGPILFLIFVNDMEDCVEHSKLRSFADDTRLLRAIAVFLDSILLQKDIDSIIKWAEKNNMLLHEDKFEFLSHKTGKDSLLRQLPFIAELHTYNTSSSCLQPAHEVKDLGITISHDLSWTPQINQMAENGKKMAAWALSVFRDRSPTTMITLYKSLIRSRLEYCCPLWNPSKVRDIIN